MWLEKIDILNDLGTVSVVVKLFLALILGGILGLEREQKQRPAGLRTYVLVCLGATLACITNLYILSTNHVSDPARIPAQVISGIGFLGAGTIIVTRKNQVKGLTTAAGLWCCAAIGIAIGSGFYSGAILCALLISVSLRILTIVDRKVSKKSHILQLYAEYDSGVFVKELSKYAMSSKYRLSDIEIITSKIDDLHTMTFLLRIDSPDKKEIVIEQLLHLNGCVVIEQIS